MAFKDCLEAIRKAGGKDLSDDEIEALLIDVADRRNAIVRTNPLTGDSEAFAKAAKDLADEERMAAIIEKRNRAINVVRKKERVAFYDANKGKESFAISTLNVGSERTGLGFGKSVDAQRLGLESQLLGPMVGELRKAGLLDVIKSGDEAFDRDVAREMWRLSGGEGEPTGNKFANHTAEILTKYQEIARQMQNDAGAWIRKMPGYIVRQSHDMAKIYSAGFETWRNTIAPLLDLKTFDHIEPDKRDGWLRAVWTDLASGNHLKSEGASDWLGGFKGPGNLAKRASQERTLHFKDADAWFDYNQKFGSNSLLESAVHGLSKAARNTALMRTWGTNPEAAFKADLDQLILRAKARGDAKETRDLAGWRIKAEMDQLTGAGNIPENPKLATVSGTIRSLESMAKLGGVVLSSLSDIAVRASTLRHNGVGLLESYGDSLASLFRGRGRGETREIADLIGASVDGMLGSVMSRFDATDNVRGRMSKLMNVYFRMNGLTWWTDAHKTGVSLMLSHNLARNAEKGFAQLDRSLRGNLTRYGISESEWDAVRKSSVKEANGRAYITPDSIHTMEGLDKREADKIEGSLRSYFIEQTREALTEGGARERALIYGNTRPGTAWGEAARFMMQFKLFGTTFATRHIARELKRDGVDKTGLAHLIVATTVLGYISQSAKQMAQGKTPMDPTDYKTWISAMAQGGGFGIYGDFIFADYNRFGGGLAESLAGPTVGTLGDVARIISTLRDQNGTHPIRTAANQALTATLGVVPFANLFYTRIALDYLILNEVHEMLSPGYLRRMEQRIKKDHGQSFFISPSSPAGTALALR